MTGIQTEGVKKKILVSIKVIGFIDFFPFFFIILIVNVSVVSSPEFLSLPPVKLAKKEVSELPPEGPSLVPSPLTHAARTPWGAIA